MKWTMPRVFGALALTVALALGAVAAFSAWPSSAANGSEVGYVDDVALVNEYLNTKAVSAISMVEEATERLQAEFDEARQGLGQAETQALFQQYELRLAAYRQELFQPFLDEIEAAIERAAEENGVTVVLSQDVVVLGGVDLNQPVRRLLGLAGE